jgi:pyruvate/2-oxoglutarate dehydrogenase complex dihydrolipoamide dehydrogenase (E3) component
MDSYDLRQNAPHDLVVVGGGPAGVVAALRARELGASVALVERGPLGGSCINDGCVPMRVLARAARMVRDASQFADYGLVGPSPRLDFPALLEETRRVVAETHANKQLAENLAEAGVTTLAGCGPARFVDEHTLALADGRLVRAERFVLSVGGRARALDFPGAEHAIGVTEIWSLPQLPASTLIIGASATGCQLASVLAAFGSQVTLLEIAPRVLPGADPLVSAELDAAFAERGLGIETSLRAVQRIDRRPDGLHVTYAGAGGPRTARADLVVRAAGWPADTSSLELEKAGVKKTRGGFVEVDERLQTTAPHIYAAGDVTGRTMLVQSADHQGRIAAENAVLGSDRAFVHHAIPFGGFTDPEYAGVGLTEPKARATEDCAVAVVGYRDLDRAVIDGRVRGSAKLIVSRGSRRVLGAHVVGEQALEVVQVVAATMKMGGRVEDLARLKIAYPTFAAILGVAARRLARELGIVPVAPHWRDLRHASGADWEGSAAGGAARPREAASAEPVS